MTLLVSRIPSAAEHWRHALIYAEAETHDSSDSNPKANLISLTNFSGYFWFLWYTQFPKEVMQAVLYSLN